MGRFFQNQAEISIFNQKKGDADRLQEDSVQTRAFEISNKQKPLFVRAEDEEVEAEVR